MAHPDHVFQALFDASPNPYLVLDRKLHIVTANPAYLASTGRTLEQIVGRWAWDAYPTDPETERMSVASFERVIRSGKPDTMALLRFDIERPADAGGGFETRWWSITHTPVFGPGGEVELVLQHPIDVTEVERLRRAADQPAASPGPLAAEQVGLIDRARQAFQDNLHLKADVERLQALFQRAPGFMAVLRGPDHVFEFVNEAVHGLFGRRGYLGRPLREVLPELVEQGVVVRLDRVYASGQEFVGYDLAVRLRDDGESGPALPITERFINLIYQPIFEDGRVAGIFVEGTDVTEQHQSHAVVEEKVVQLQHAEQRLAFQLELADALRPLDSAGEVIAAASGLLGERLQLGRVVFAELVPPAMRVAVRRDWCAPGLSSIAGIETTLDDFGPGMADELRAGREVLVRDAERDERTAGHLAAYQAIGVRAHLTIPLLRGGLLRAVVSLHARAPRDWTVQELRMAQDMAERTWAAAETAGARAALREERDQSQYIFDTMTEGFGILDRDWTIARMNATGLQMLQMPAHEVVGRNNWEVFPQAVGTEIERLCRQVRETGEAGSVEFPYALPRGGRRWLDVRVLPALHGRLAIFFRDVSGRREAEEELRLEGVRKDEFLAMLAHELRNPLAPIGAAADLLGLGRLAPDQVKRTSAIIARQVGHMTSLIDDLLDVSRVTRGLVALECEPVDVKAVVADAVEQVRPLAEARRHRLEVHLAPECTVVAGDRKRLVQVLANLLGNAAKYTPDGGRIVLHMEVDDADPGQVTLCVIDDGIGMTLDVQRRAFELFTQAERTPDRAQGGLGIGLALVKSLVELHGGSVAVHSDGPGRGSQFTVRLPRMAERRADTGGERTPVERLAAPGNAARRSVLVVDDNVDAAQLLAMVLENVGYRVTVEHYSRRALEIARETAPDICILDIGLPDMDGNELARRLRELPGMQGAMLVAVTGYGRQQDREMALAAGFDHHLVKPVDLHRLAGLLSASSLKPRTA